MSIKSLPRDIYGISMHITERARMKEFREYLRKLDNLNLINPQRFVGDLIRLVSIGILSPQSATYFVAGRASSSAVLKLDTFLNTVDYYGLSSLEIFKTIQKWLPKEPAVAESTFLFPLEELVSNDSFESERKEYENVDYRDLSKIGI